MTTEEAILKITRQLYPTGRAFRISNESWRHKLHRGLAISEAKAYDDAASILNSVLPDNQYFTSDDATDWESRLALTTNLAVPLQDRMLAILRKMQAPGTNPAKSTAQFLESQLQAAGFNVYVYENLIALYPSGFDTYNPVALNSNIYSVFRQGMGRQGQFRQGGFINSVVANSISNSVDIGFDVGNSLRSTFFIGGPTLGSYANVLAAREQEFRQLILQLKQVQSIAYLFINYI